MTVVPYWITRNSWSAGWGQSGFFHMAMYPFNKVAQFDKYVLIDTPSGRGEAGGQVLFMPTTKRLSSFLGTSNVRSTSPPTLRQTIMGRWYNVVFLVILVLIVVYFFFKGRMGK